MKYICKQMQIHAVDCKIMLIDESIDSHSSACVGCSTKLFAISINISLEFLVTVEYGTGQRNPDLKKLISYALEDPAIAI